MAERISALDGHIEKGRFGVNDNSSGSLSENTAGVIMTLITDLKLHQVAAWPANINEVAKLASNSIGKTTVAAPGRSVGTAAQAVLRIEPLKWWLLGTELAKIDEQVGAALDLSHSRTRLRISGPDSATLINRFMPIDLRAHNFPTGSVASSAIHHVGVTLWHNELGYDLFIPRGFAVSIWEVLFESSLQFGVDVI